MELAFYQTAWHDVPLKELGGDASEVAGPGVYSAFYGSLEGKEGAFEAAWIEQKKRQGGWIAETFLADVPSASVLSVGAGLGWVEQEIFRRGFKPDVLECEPNALAAIEKKIPGIRGFVGDARQLPCDDETYDVAYLSAVDYCFTRQDYERVLSELRRVIKPGGRVVSVCVSNLSLKGLVKGLAKKALGRGPGPDAVLWGYQRSVAEHLKAASAGGLACARIFVFDHDFRLKGVRFSGRAGFSRMTVSDDIVALEFVRAS